MRRTWPSRRARGWRPRSLRSDSYRDAYASRPESAAIVCLKSQSSIGQLLSGIGLSGAVRCASSPERPKPPWSCPSLRGSLNRYGGFGLPGEPGAGARGLSGPIPSDADATAGIDGHHPPRITAVDISLTGNKPKGGNFDTSWPLAKEAHSHRLGQNECGPKPATAAALAFGQKPCLAPSWAARVLATC